MFSFANPQYLYLLLLLPVVAALFVLARRARRRKLRGFGQQAQASGLMPQASAYKPWVMLTLQLLVLALVVVILARPRGGARTTNATVHGIEVMVALDVSNSMNAPCSSDPGDVSRLQRAKLVLQKLIDQLGGNKVGLIVFAGNSYMQMPLTGDTQSAKMFLNNISTNMAPTQGTAIGSAINMALTAFSPNPKTQKAIIVITDGENFEDDARKAAAQAHKAGVQVNVVGIGSTTPTQIPQGDGSVLLDDNGKPALTRLDEQSAQQIADAGKGVYVNGAASDAAETLSESLRKLSKSDLGTYSYSLQDEQFPIFAWIALVLLVSSMLVIERKSPLLSRFNFFTKEKKDSNEKNN